MTVSIELVLWVASGIASILGGFFTVNVHLLLLVIRKLGDLKTNQSLLACKLNMRLDTNSNDVLSEA